MTINRVEMSVFKFILARFKSKSPKGYALLTKICGFSASAMIAYVIIYNQGILPKSYATIEGQIDNICVVLGAALTALGLGSASSTTDPALMSEEAKKNVIAEAVDSGTHVPNGPNQN